MSNNKTSFKSYLIGIVAFAGGYLLFKLALGMLHVMSSPHTIGYDNTKMSDGIVTVELMKVADSMNKLMPLQVDSLTQFTKVQSLPNKVLELTVRLNIDSSRYNIAKFKNALDSGWYNEVIMNEEMKPFRDNNVSFIYDFFDMHNNFMFSLKYSPEMYHKWYNK